MNLSEEKDPIQEIVRYREKAIKAAALGKGQLARCWRLAADEAQQVLRQKKSTNIFSPKTVPFINQIALLIHSNQEGNYYFDNNLKESAASHWAFARDETQEAVSTYRYWIALNRAGTSKNLEQEIQQTTLASSHYNPTIPEAARAAKEAAAFFKKTQEEQQLLTQHYSVHHEFLIHRWKRAAYEAAYLADIYVQRATIAAGENHHSWTKLIALAEQTLFLRIKAAKATQSQVEEEAIQYSLAAYAATNAVESLLQMVTIPGKILEEGATRFFCNLAEKIVHYRVKKNETSRTNPMSAALWDKAASWIENGWDAQLLAFEARAKKAKYPLISFYWEQSGKASEQAATLLAKEARARTILHFLNTRWWEKYADHLEKRAKKKIPIIFMKKISFCLLEHFLPTHEWRKKWEEEQPIHFGARSKSPTVTSWVYQTWSFLKKAGVDCDLSTQFPTATSDGIFITMTKLLKSTIVRPPSLTSLFLVDILADGAPHPAANLHLVENRVYASYLPSSLFVPHWPQPFLIPRDPTRGTRFENICFFGEIQNLAPELRSQEWSQRLYEELGLHFKIREPRAWNDYSDIDCAVAIRDFSKSSHINKPATKLYNAWLAGVPFIGGRDSAYAADGRPGKNYLVATSLEEVFQHLKHLKEDTLFRARLIQEGLQSGQAFTKEATLEHWKKLIQEIIPVRAFQWRQRSTFQRACFFFIQRVVCWFHHFYFKKAGFEK